MKIKWFLLLMIALFAVSSAGDAFPPKHRVGHITMPSTYYSPAIGEFVQNWNEPAYVYAFNSYTDTLKVGYLVTWNDTKTLVDSAARASACDTLALDDTTTTYRWKQLRFKGLNALSACSLDITGLDTAGSALTETGLVINGSANVVKYSNYLWRKITQIIWRHGAANDTLVTYNIPYVSVTATTSANSVNVAGVVAVQALADSLVKIQTRGFVQVYLTGATTEVQPGMEIQTSSTAGYGAVTATEVTGAGAGKATQSGNTNALYWVQMELE